jgi:hypothetical protein
MHGALPTSAAHTTSRSPSESTLEGTSTRRPSRGSSPQRTSMERKRRCTVRPSLRLSALSVQPQATENSSWRLQYTVSTPITSIHSFSDDYAYALQLHPGNNGDQARARAAQGFDLVSVVTDIDILTTGFANALATARGV